MSKKSIVFLSLSLLLFILLSVLYLEFANRLEPSPASQYLVHNGDTGRGYHTIQEAIDAPETSDGDIISVDAGIFHEHIVLRKSVFLVHSGLQTTIIDGDGNGTVVSVQSDATISGFTIQNGSTGIAIVSSGNGRINNDTVQFNEEAISVFSSSNWTISGNLITSNYDAGLVLNNSDNNAISNNTVSSNCQYIHDAIDLYNSSHNDISDNNLVNNQAAGIYITEYGSYNNISHNMLVNNIGGIELVKSCNYNTIEWNSVIVSETTLGLPTSIWIRESQFNTVYANEITSDRNSSVYEPPYVAGVGLSESTNNSVVSNKISLMDTGVGFHFSCDNNWVVGNTLNRNGHGIDFTEGISNRNIIYSNNFIENAEQVHIGSSANSWDSGYPTGGNYWSDYKIRYSNATEIDSSGKWNIPYIIDANNVDRYPLKFPIVQNPSH
jgi:parallel beta-helix repeat protein